MCLKSGNKITFTGYKVGMTVQEKFIYLRGHTEFNKWISFSSKSLVDGSSMSIIGGRPLHENIYIAGFNIIKSRDIAIKIANAIEENVYECEYTGVMASGTDEIYGFYFMSDVAAVIKINSKPIYEHTA